MKTEEDIAEASDIEVLGLLKFKDMQIEVLNHALEDALKILREYEKRYGDE